MTAYIPDTKIAVAGAGLTGLSAALELQRSGCHVDVFEKRDVPGGVIRTSRTGEWQTEAGPNTLLLKEKRVSDFLGVLGIEGEKSTAGKQAKKRYIVRRGRLAEVPASLSGFLKSGMLSPAAKLALLKEPFVTAPADRDQSVADFTIRHFGKQVLDYAVNPFVAGIYANQPEVLSLRHVFPALDETEQRYGSLIRGWYTEKRKGKRSKQGKIPRQLISFPHGLQAIPEAIAGQLNDCHFRHAVKKVVRKEDCWYIESDKAEHGPYHAVIMNIPLHKWTTDLLPVSRTDLLRLNSVDYPPLSVMTLGFRTEDITHPLDGYGFLVPEVEKRNILGALFSSSLFEGRAPGGHHLITVFVGGGRQPEIASMESEKLLGLVLRDLKELIGIREKPVFKEHYYWPHSIPAYHVGYDGVLDTLSAIESRNPGLHLVGNFRNGVSLPDCILNGLQLAEDILT